MAEPLDLAPIKARYIESSAAVDWVSSDPWEVIADVPALVAEVERLRATLERERTEHAQWAFDAGRATGEYLRNLQERSGGAA